jgi:Mg-chelatase subunit ChlD
LGSVAVATEPDAEPAANEQRPRIDVVFVLDTTGSMSNLIEGAKRKIWSILNQIVAGKPTPEVRVGLIGFRDRGDEYVTQVTDLTEDIDELYSKLMAFRAGGGGDTPESVNQAVHEAVTKIAWSEGDKVLRVVFLVGDSPPHMDYSDDVKYPDACQLAARKGIIINTVRCGGNAQTEKIWKEIADLAEGTYVSLAQSGGMAEISTPFDDDIAKIDRELRGTTVFYGDGLRRTAARRALEKTEATLAEAPAEAVADRALYVIATPSGAEGGGSFGAVAGADLVTAYEGGKVDLEKIKESELPDELKKMSTDERKAYLDRQVAHRKALREKLEQLNKKRGAFIDAQMKKGPARDAFDEKVIGTIRDRAAKIGVTYER